MHRFSHQTARNAVNPRAHVAIMSEPAIEDAIALHRDKVRPGRFYADVSDDWEIVFLFGGVSMYVALRAMCQAVRRPASVGRRPSTTGRAR
jgi:hypothetical protein